MKNQNLSLFLFDKKNNSIIDTYIKKHLNYKKVKVNNLKVGKVYEMPFKMVK